MRHRLLLTLSCCLLAGTVMADAKILPMRERAALVDRWPTTRVQTVLPDLMRRADIDIWIIISRDYNEDPVLMFHAGTRPCA